MSAPDESVSAPTALPGTGSWRQKLRLVTGLVMFAFVATHLINHAMGLVSIEAMEAVRDWRVAVTRSTPGTVILASALVIHIALGLWKFAWRRTWRMSWWEGVQLAFGLLIPIVLFRHILALRLPHELYGLDDDYHYALWVMWPGEAWAQATLITLAWVHGCLGLHFWLRLKPWYRRVALLLYAPAVLVPVLAFAGFAVAGRTAHAAGDYANPFTPEQFALVAGTLNWAMAAAGAVVLSIVAYRLVRQGLDRIGARIRVVYPDGRVAISGAGPTLLEISRAHGIPHASVCGGRARCSTCRVRIVSGGDRLAAPNPAEARVLDRIHAGPDVRLACQTRPAHDVAVAPLLPPYRTLPDDVTQQDRYVWGVEQVVVVMFADLRGFTALAESRLAYDTVFLLNQYLTQMGAAIERSGGYVDKFIGDGIMAIFGIRQPPARAAANALAAAREMGLALEELNRVLEPDLPEPLDIGIGLHLGAAVLGRIGVAGRAGATGRITALGDTVNTASRLESMTRELGVQLVLSVDVARAAGLDDRALGPHREIGLRGKSKPLEAVLVARAASLEA